MYWEGFGTKFMIIGSVEVCLIELFCFEKAECHYIENAIFCEMSKIEDFSNASEGHFM